MIQIFFVVFITWTGLNFINYSDCEEILIRDNSTQEPNPDLKSICKDLNKSNYKDQLCKSLIVDKLQCYDYLYFKEKNLTKSTFGLVFCHDKKDKDKSSFPYILDNNTNAPLEFGLRCNPKQRIQITNHNNSIKNHRDFHFQDQTFCNDWDFTFYGCILGK